MRALALLSLLVTLGCRPMFVADDLAQRSVDLLGPPRDLALVADGARRSPDLQGSFGPGTPATTPTVMVPAGTYTIGCVAGDKHCGPYEQEPATTAMVAALRLDTHEVTQSQYQSCIGAGACTLPATMAAAGGPGAYDPVKTPNFPVGGATLNQAVKYCTFAGGRLPTEVEWEAAARGGDTRIYPWGDAPPSCARASYDACGRAPVVVDSNAAGTSPLGIENLAGNGAELTSSANPNVPGGYVAKGGSYDSNGDDLRISARLAIAGADAFVPVDVGFRCAR